MRVINFPYAGIDRFTDRDVRVCPVLGKYCRGFFGVFGVENLSGWGAECFIMGFRMRELGYPVVLYYIHRGICCVVQKFATLWWDSMGKDC